MNKSGKSYKNQILQKHLAVTGILLGLLIFGAWYMDNMANSVVVDFIQRVFNWQVANKILRYKNYYIISITLVILIISWLVVEFREVARVAKMLDQMEEACEKEEGISLEVPFKTVEQTVNYIRGESRLNWEKAQIEAERKNDLITYLAHDIRTPLASIIGYLNLLDEIPDIPLEQRAKYVGITLKKAYRLEELINEFFDITRFNLSSLPLEKEEIPLKFMLEQLTEEFYPMLSVGNRRTDVAVPEELLIYGDRDKLARVFSNLLKNAIAYSYENTTVMIEGKVMEDKVVVMVTNQGKQIPREKLNMIFDKFFRLDASRATTTGGAGLGLAIAKEIVVSHGGEIDAESNEKNTVFTVKLPT